MNKLSMKKRGQAATEFLMTYGWIVLVALLIIGALNFIGVFDAKAMLPEKCELQQRLICKGHKIVANDGGINGHINLDLLNGMGHDIVIKKITAKAVGDIQIDCLTAAPDGVFNEDCDLVAPAAADGICLADGERKSDIAIDCTAASIPAGIDVLYEGKGKREIELEIYWYWDTGVTSKEHIIFGRLYAEVETP